MSGRFRLGALHLLYGLGLAGAFVAATAAGGATALWTGNLVQLLAAGSAGAMLAVRSSRSTGRERWSWVLLAIAAAGWFCGQALWSFDELILHRPSPFPSLADAGFLIFPIASVAAVALFPAGRARLRSLDVLDGVVLTLALASISWVTGLEPILSSASASVPALSVSLAYPVGDFVVLTMALLALGRATRHRVPLGLVSAGMVAMGVSDVVFTYRISSDSYATGAWLDVGWVLAFIILGQAANAGRRMSSAGQPDQTEDAAHDAASSAAVVAYASLLAAVIAGGLDVLRDGRIDAGAVVIVSIAFTLALARQFLTTRDNRLLMAELVDKAAAMRHAAMHDPLTGLANRALFVDDVAAALEGHRETGRPLAVLFCDLDDFKGVNDGLGHAAGDELLRQVARRLEHVVGRAGLLARLGGDEFAVLMLGDRPPAHARTRRERKDDPIVLAALAMARQLRAAFVDMASVCGHEVRVSLSIGISCLTPSSDTPTIDALLGQADVAMYSAKRSPGVCELVYRPGLALPESEDWRMLPALSSALDCGVIEAHFQPIFHLGSSQLYGFESLARWTNDGTRVSPGEFLPVLARAGLMSRLTQHILVASARQLRAWSSAAGQLRVAVNISPSEIVDLRFPRLIEVVIEELRLPRGGLVIEVTEEALLGDMAAAASVATALRDLGVLIALDDFGAGFSSLAHLHHLPLDTLKLDRSFVATVDSDPRLRTLLGGVLAIAGDLGLTVVAEGIERRQQAEVLQDLGCPLGQGFFFSPALPADQLEPLILAR